MPLDPNSEFDHALLDAIEHSPTGAVPYTPAYRDSLRRLIAAHQVYPSAEHKDGYVTARSLAALPVFHAENLEVLKEGTVELLEPNAAVFERYVQSLPAALQPKAESHRATVAVRPAQHRAKHGLIVAHDPVHTLFLVPGSGPHPGLPGSYLYGFVAEGGSSGWSVHLHDSEDGAVLCQTTSVQEALEKLQEVLDSAPFDMTELESLGFHFT